LWGGALNCSIEGNRIHRPNDIGTTLTGTYYGIWVAAAGIAGQENKIFNNAIYNFNNFNGAVYGIYHSSGGHLRVWHNTISLDQTTASGTGTITRGIWISLSSAVNVQLRNNIITIKRGGTGLQHGIWYGGSSNLNLTSNNNAVFIQPATTRHFGYWAFANRTTLANWQSISAQDLNSIAADPLYLNLTTGDLTPTNGAINNIGTGVGVLTDITGSPRSAVAPDPGAYEFSVGGLDAGISWVSPLSPATTGLKTITVNVNNTQTITITDLVLRYSVGATVIQTQTFTGLNLPGGSNSNFSFSTQYNLTGTTTFTAEIVSVNGGADAISGNNITNQTVCVGLSGIYTINSGAATGGTNFQNFNAAISALSCGISGPVTFNVVAGSGPYTEQVIIPQILNASAVNTITFNGNGNTLQFNAISTLDPSTLEMNGADWFRFNDMVFQSTNASTGFAVHLWNSANNNIFTNCTMSAPLNTTSSISSPFSISGSKTSATTSGASGINNIVDGCTLTGGYYGASFVGNSAASNTGNQLINSVVRDFHFYGVYTLYENGLVIRNNTIDRLNRTTLTTFYGIFNTTGSVGLVIDRNRIRKPFAATTGTLSAYGIYNFVASTLGNETKITNNLITDFNTTGLIYGIYITGNYTQVYHNTVSLDEQSPVSSTTYGIFSTATIGIDVRNNNVVITRGGSGTKYCIYFSSSTGKISNYNNLFINSPAGLNYVGYSSIAYTTFASWQGTGFDLNSTNADPVYVDAANGDYSPSSSTVDNTGTPVGVTVDVNGTPRSLTTPDVGAVEFILAPVDIAAQALITPAAGECLSSSQTVVVRVRNAGTQPLDFTLNPATVTVNVSGGTTATLTGIVNSGTLAVNATLDVSMSGTVNLGPVTSYTFNFSATVVGDGNSNNNTKAPVTINKVFTAGTVSASNTNHCASSPAPTMTLSGAAGGNIQ
jgi:hypothetical protein